MTRGTRVAAMVSGFLAVTIPVTLLLSPMLMVMTVSGTLLVAAVVLLAGHLRDARTPGGARQGTENAPFGSAVLLAQLRPAPAYAGPLAEVIPISAAWDRIAEPPAAGRLATVTDLDRFRRPERTELPVAR